MPERVDRRPARAFLARACAALVLGVAVLGIVAPGAALGRVGPDGVAAEIHQAAVPEGERCTEGTPNLDAGLKICDKPFLSGDTLLPIFGGAALVGVLALLGTFLFFRRRASVPLSPIDAAEWWACPKCGSTNVVGSPRCYSCGTWQR
jgi:hypothetical protein